MALVMRKGVLARMSSSKSSTTSASRASWVSARDEIRRVLTTTARGVTVDLQCLLGGLF